MRRWFTRDHRVVHDWWDSPVTVMILLSVLCAVVVLI